MSKGKTSAAMLLAALLVAIVAGCGGGGSSSSSSDSSTGGSTESQSSGEEEGSLTKPQFIAKADGICTASSKKLNGEVEKYVAKEGISEKAEPTKDQETELVEKYIVPSLRTEGEELGDLTPPDGDEEQVEKIVDGLEEGVDEAEDDPELITGGSSTNPFETAAKEAQAYGLKVCGSA